MKKIFYMSLLATFLTGCATVDWNDPKIVSQYTQSTNDEYTKISTTEGPTIRDKTNENSGNDRRFYQIRQLKSTSHKSVKSYQIVAIHKYLGYESKYYTSAYDINGIEFKISGDDKKVISCYGAIGCEYGEILGLDVSEDYLNKNRTTGIKFRLGGKNGKAEFFIPPTYIQGFLSKVQAN